MENDRHSSSPKRFALAVLIGTALIEIITCIGRFGVGVSIKANEDTVTRFTLGIRIHHGYVGVAIALLAALAFKFGWFSARVSRSLAVIGLSLFASDLIHHFIVLYLATGRTEFP